MAREAERGGSLFLLVQGGRLRRRLTPALGMSKTMKHLFVVGGKLAGFDRTGSFCSLSLTQGAVSSLWAVGSVSPVHS